MNTEEQLAKAERERDEAINALHGVQASLQRKVRHCDEITEERNQMERERDEARAEVGTWKHDWYVAKTDLGTAMRLADVALRDLAEKYEHALRERDEARAEVQDYREQLRQLPDANRVASQDAFRRGAEAMREACAIRGGDKAYERMTKFWPPASGMKQAVRDAIRALPIPEEP